MSKETLELARRGVAAFTEGDWETLLSLFDPEIEWEETSGLGPDAATYRGIDEVRNAVMSWTDMWTEYTLEVHEYLDAGDDVVVLFQEQGRGRSTGASVEREFGEILTFRAGKLIRNRLYGSWAEARKAAGLSD